MQRLPESTRRRLHVQGFRDVPDEVLADVHPWLRLAPAITLAWAVAGTLLASPFLIWALTPFAALGAVLPGHPFDVIYHFGIRRLIGGRVLPAYRAPRRFCCKIATVWLGLTGLAFYLHMPAAGYVLGAIFALAASLPVTTDICLPAYVHRFLFGERQTCTTCAA